MLTESVNVDVPIRTMSMLPRLRRGAEGEALPSVATAERWMRERLVAVFGKDQQRAHLLCDLPHQTGVVDVLLDRRLVACGVCQPGIAEC